MHIADNPAGNPSRAGRAGNEVASLVRGGSASAYSALLKKHIVEAVKNSLKSVTPKKLFLAAVVVFIVMLFGRNIKDILLVAALGIAASYSTIYKRTIRVPSAVELVTFGTIVTGAAYGPAVGAMFGVITTIASEIISSGVDVNTLFYAIARGIAGGLAQMMVAGFGWSVVIAGMAALVIFHVVSDFIYVVSGGIEAVPKIIYFIIVNTLFNLIVFSFFGSFLLGIAVA
ncbi:hypothetical protein HYU16_01670 [Candidatus Woesearchaeota archaeon]|nr:hypothetical protein [Candidatus Woesearchaeota archaeon]